jgi:hypothetical protein
MNDLTITQVVLLWFGLWMIPCAIYVAIKWLTSRPPDNYFVRKPAIYDERDWQAKFRKELRDWKRS